MKGYKVSQGKKKVIIVYANVITEEEKKIIREFYIPAGYEIQTKTKDIAGIMERAEANGFSSPVSHAHKDELLKFVEEKDPENLTKWTKAFETVKKGGLGFSKAKAEFRKTYPNYPENASATEKKPRAKKK